MKNLFRAGLISSICRIAASIFIQFRWK